MKEIDNKLKESCSNWILFSGLHGKNPKNFKRTIRELINKLNKWLEPLNLTVTITPIDKKASD